MNIGTNSLVLFNITHYVYIQFFVQLSINLSVIGKKKKTDGNYKI